MKLAEIAAQINAHLKRLETDKAWNRYTWTDRKGVEREESRLYYAGAGYHGGSRVSVIYVIYQGQSHLTKAEALAYLEWLDAGNKGQHFKQQRETTP